MKRRTVFAIIGVVALVGLLVVGGLAVAQTAGFPRWAGPHRAWGNGHWGPGHRFGPSPQRVREERAEVARDLAAQLDQPPDRVEAAFRAVVVQRVDEAVASGRMDRATADEALAAYDEGNLRGLVRVFKEDR